MEILHHFDSVSLFLITFFALYYADKRFNWGLNDMAFALSSDRIDKNERSNKINEAKDDEIAKLKERIKVLEAIVTDPKEQLRKEIDSL